MDERDLLALLHRGGRALRTVRLVGKSRTDHEAVSRALERWSRTQRDAVRMYARGPSGRPQVIEERARLWIEIVDGLRPAPR